MNGTLEHPVSSPYSAKEMRKPVNFYFSKPNAKSVNLVGDFNDWNPGSLPMERRVDGWWFIQVPLTHGHHPYVFLVDGEPMLDPKATGTIHIDRYANASVIAVS